MDENKIASNALIGEACVPLKGLLTRPVQQFRRLLDPESDVSNHIFLTTNTVSKI